MNTPSATPVQIGAGTVYAGVATACIATGVHGLDLIAYLASASIVTGITIYADAKIRGHRAENAGMLRIIERNDPA